MSTIKAKNIKQTVIGGTTQPLKLGGILEDGSDAKISIDTSGNLTASNLTATLNGLLTTNGQIKFPATQNPSSDANTLDDYEEGTWTPTLQGSGTYNHTYSNRFGYYTKIGDIVHITFFIVISSKDSGMTSNVYISGLPFTIKTYGGVSFSQMEGITMTSPYNNEYGGMLNPSSTILSLRGVSNGSYDNIYASNLASSGVYIIGSATYKIA